MEHNPGFSKFCQQTTFNGFLFIDEETTVTRRFIWIVVLVRLQHTYLQGSVLKTCRNLRSG
jgi:hypothetical protein